MAIAGRVAIVPKGAWSQDVTYDKLDLVMFNNDAYIAKKASTDIEPTDDEYWMLILNNVVAEDLEKIIDGTTPVGNALALGGKDASEYALGTDLANYLPNSGGDITANDIPYIKFKSASYPNTYSIVRKFGDGVRVGLHSTDGSFSNELILGSDTQDEHTLLRLLLNDSTFREILHTGNVGDYALPKSGGEINGTTDLKSYDATNIAMNVANSLRSIGMRVYSNGVADFFDYTNNKNIFRSMADGTNTFNGTASGNLPLSGGTLNGTLTLKTYDNGFSKIHKSHDTTADYGTVITDEMKDGSKALLILEAKRNAITFRDTAGNNRDILHTGNKPSGTYTGNGSAYQNVAVGGTGEFVMVSTDGKGTKSDFVIVSQNGYFGKVGGAVVQGNNMYTTSGGALIIDGVTAFLTSGKQYRYQRL